MNKNRVKLCILLFIFYVTKLSQCKFAHRRDDGEGTIEDLPVPGAPLTLNEVQESDKEQIGKKTCWIPLKGQQHFENMNKLEQKYKDVREAYARDIDTNHFDKRMLDAMTKTRGIAERALQKFAGIPSVIPAGLNLGSNCMVRMPGSILFFYRLKLRNNTRFVVNYIQNDVEQLSLTMRLSLNDLHLVGEYERALTSNEDPSRLYYRPSKGAVEFLLKDVKYKVEGRYRLLGDRLHIEHIISEIPPMAILMRYASDSEGKSTPMDPDSIQDYLQRLKNDLDHWLKDYFNDFLMLYGLEEFKKNDKIQEYENERMIVLNQYADQVIELLNKRLRTLGAANLMMPDFMLTAANGMEIKLFDGAVRNVDSMYRRSVTTGKLDGKVRKINTEIGFSGLKVEYRYDTYTRTGLPPLSGMLVLNSNDVSAHLALQVVNYDEGGTEDLLITYLQYGKPPALTVEGPANRIIANFKHLLEHHIISIMTSAMIHNIRTLSSLVKCEPDLAGKDDPKISSGDDDISDDVDKDDDVNHPSENSKEDNVNQPSSDSKENDKTPSSSDSKNNDNVSSSSDGKGNDVTPSSSDSNDNDVPPSSSDSKDNVTPAPPSDSNDNDVTPSSSANNDNDVIPSSSGSKDDDVTPPSSESKENDDVNPPTSDSKENDVTPLPSDNKDDDFTPPPSDSKSDDTSPLPQVNKDDDSNQAIHDYQSDDPNELKPDYAFARKESIELELPPKPGSAKGETLKLDHNETFTLTKLNTNDFSGAKLRSGSGFEKAPDERKGGKKIESATLVAEH